MSDAKTAAKAVKVHAGSFSTGDIELWGMKAVRPGDVVYGLKAVAAERNILTLVLDPGGAEVPLVIWDPKGVKATKEGVVVTSASRIRFEGWDVSLHRDQLAIANGAGVGSKKVAKKPALQLKVAGAA